MPRGGRDGGAPDAGTSRSFGDFARSLALGLGFFGNPVSAFANSVRMGRAQDASARAAFGGFSNARAQAARNRARLGGVGKAGKGGKGSKGSKGGRDGGGGSSGGGSSGGGRGAGRGR